MGFGLGVVVRFGDRFRGSGGAVILGEVAAMQEEVWEDAVKEAAAVAVAFLAVAEQPEVLRRPWRHVRPQLNHDAAWGRQKRQSATLAAAHGRRPIGP